MTEQPFYWIAFTWSYMILYSFEELVAEIGPCFLQSYGGIPIDDLENEVAHWQHWLKVLKDDKKFIIKAAAAAQKAVEYILNTSVEVKAKEDSPIMLVDEMALEFDEVYND